MSVIIIIVYGLFLLAIISGILGLGVAFAAIPFLELFLPDLVNAYSQETEIKKLYQSAQIYDLRNSF